MDATLKVNGIKTNFYKNPIATYKAYSDWLTGNKTQTKKFTEIKTRFKIYAALLIIGLMIYPLIGLIFYLTRK